MTENLGVVRFIRELKKLNPQAYFEVTDYSVSPVIIIHGNVPVSRLRLPDGYYLSDKNGLTNKHNTTTGLYEGFIYKQNPSLFQKVRQFLARMIG